MKNTILFLVMICSPILMIAQEQSLSSVPVLAGKHLQTNYPDAIVLDWIRLTADQIAAQFQINENTRVVTEAVYTNDGQWISTQERSQHNASVGNASRPVLPFFQNEVAIEIPRKIEKQ